MLARTNFVVKSWHTRHGDVVPTLFEIRARTSSLSGQNVDIVQVELRDGKRSRGISMINDITITGAISCIVDWAGKDPDITGWMTYKALEGWLASWGSRTYFKETGIDWDPNAGDDSSEDNPNGMSTHPLDKKLTNAVHGLGRRLGHKAVPLAVAQVIEAYLLAQEYDALVGYLKSINAETVQVML